MPEIKKVIRKRRGNKKRPGFVMEIDKQILLRRERLKKLGIEFKHKAKHRADNRKGYEKRLEREAIESGRFQFFKSDDGDY